MKVKWFIWIFTYNPNTAKWKYNTPMKIIYFYNALFCDSEKWEEIASRNEKYSNLIVYVKINMLAEWYAGICLLWKKMVYLIEILDCPIKLGNDKKEIATPPERRFAMTANRNGL
jgi:hypothetical protein